MLVILNVQIANEKWKSTPDVNKSAITLRNTLYIAGTLVSDYYIIFRQFDSLSLILNSQILRAVVFRTNNLRNLLPFSMSFVYGIYTTAYTIMYDQKEFWIFPILTFLKVR